MTDISELAPALPEIFLLLAAMGLLMLGVFRRSEESTRPAALSRFVSRLALGAIAFTLVLLWLVSGDEPQVSFAGMFILDGFALFLKVFILVASGLSLVIAQDFLETNRTARFEYPVLALFATAGMMMMVSANNLLSLYVGLEMQSLSLYVVAAFQRDDLRSSEAGLKYFVLGALASGMLLYGSSLVYGYAGTIGFAELAAGLEAAGEAPSAGLVVGLVFLLAGLAFKVSAVPFHMWTPDVYEGAPTPVTAFFSVAPKLAAIGLLVRVLIDPFEGLARQWQDIVILVSVGSMLLGAFAAIGQTNIKRLMAYSSIGHVGYALIGLAAGTEAGVRGVMIYMAIYIFMNLGVFTAILCMRRRERMVEGIADLAGLSKSHPMMALALAIFMFSMAGIPPLAGFFGKIYVFLAAVEAGLFTLAVIGVLTSVVSAYYYLRIVKIMYFDEISDPLDRTISRDVGLTMLGTSILVLLFFLYPKPLLTSAARAAAALMGG